MKRKPTVEEISDLFIKTLHDLDRALIDYGESMGTFTRAAFRKVYTDALAAGCELIGTPAKDWECIFDHDRPKEEWNLLDNIDLLGPSEGAD